MTKTFSLALNTFRELVRGKVLYSTFFFAVTVIVISSLFGSVTIGDQVSVVKDFGLFSITFCAAAFCVISGASLLNKELSKRTVFTILAKPVSRLEFLLGKFSGMAATAALMILIMSVMLAGFVSLLEGQVDVSLLPAGIFIFCQMLIVCASAIFFSSMVVTPVLAGLFTFCFFLAGRSVEYVLYFVKEGEAGEALSRVLNVLYYLLPNLSSMNVSRELVSNSAGVDLPRLLVTVLYSAGYSAVLLVTANLIFSRREFN